MTNTINDLRTKLQSMLDATDNKQQIEEISALNVFVDKLEAEHTQLQNEQKDLLKDYKELVKHTSFAPNGTETQQVPEQKEVRFEDFLKAKPQQNN